VPVAAERDPETDLDLEPGEDELARSTDDGPPPGEVGTGDPVEESTPDPGGRAP